MPRKLIYDQWGGVASVIEHDDLQKTTTFAQYQDFTPIFENNKKLQTAGDGYTDQSKWRRRVASVPNVLLMKWLREAGIPVIAFMRNPRAYQAWLRKRIYDPDNQFVLTAPHARPNGAHQLLRA
jgi:hypothetical protein